MATLAVGPLVGTRQRETGREVVELFVDRRMSRQHTEQTQQGGQQQTGPAEHTHQTHGCTLTFSNDS